MTRNSNIHGKEARRECLVLDAEGQSSLPVIESLRNQGFVVTAGSYKPINMGFFSRYPSKRVLYPSPKTSPEAFLDRLLELVRQRRYEFVFPIDDHSSELLSAHKESFTPFTRLPVVDFDIFMKGRDKSLTLKCAREHGVPHPDTRYPGEESIAEIARAAAYPVLVKPNISNGARGISLVSKADELEPTYRRIQSEYGECHIQEYIPKGGLQYKADLFLGDDQQLRAGIVYSKLRYYPVNGGSSVINRTVIRPDILGYAATLLRAMKWRGFADFDFITDPRDGIPKLMEINPRIPNCFRITQAAGIDFAAMIARHAMGEDCPTVEGYETDVYLRYLPLDVLWFLQSPERFRATPSFFKFFGKNLHDQILSFRDPGPLLGFCLDNLLALFQREARATRYSRGWSESGGGNAGAPRHQPLVPVAAELRPGPNSDAS
jgi:predicted ATP-grasp superfamily ATP-dependent carboligase